MVHRNARATVVETATPAADFDGFAGTYEEILDRSVRFVGEDGEYFADLKAHYLANLLDHAPCGKVLDFGCGVGLLSRFLLMHLPSWQLHGYDISPASVAAIPRERSSRGRFTSLQSELDSDYDLIVVANVLHHVQRDQRQTLINDLQKRLCAGGRLVAFEHNPLNPLTRFAVRQCPFDAGAVLLWPRELLGYFKGARLLLQRRDYITFFPHCFAWLRPFEPRLSWCPFGAQYAVVGRNEGLT